MNNDKHQNFRIHGICLAKNEVDIIEETLISAVNWCDYIYCYDNGSNDGTWQKILELSNQYHQIIPYKTDGKVFSNELRGEVFREYKSNGKNGDWWCILDADEMYIDNPYIFLSKVPLDYDTVWNASFQYAFTDKDLIRYNEAPDLYSNKIPIEERLRYYRSSWSELRFFRHKHGLIWPEDSAKPTNLKAIYPVRIWLKHYQYRSPEQIQKRLKTRYEAMTVFPHEFQAVENCDWQNKIVSSCDLDYDSHDMKYILREEIMPKIPKNLVLELQLIFQELYQRFSKLLNKISNKFANLLNA